MLSLIGLLFFIRLIHITDPPIEIAHNWRQTTSLMVARNFYQVDNNIFYPRIDDCGDKTGIVGMEFPLLSYLVYGVSTIFGYDHWYGRLINLIIVSFGIWYFYRLIGLYFSKRTALYAAIAFALSGLFHYARKVMPDPMALSLIIIGLYNGIIYLRNGRWQYLIGYFLFALLGTLVKIPFGLYLALLIYPFIQSRIALAKKLYFAFACAIILWSLISWYFIWNIHISETYGLWYNSGRTFTEGWNELLTHPMETLEKFYFNAFHGYLFFGVCILGLILSITHRQRKIGWLFLVLIPLYCMYMIKSGYLFYHHGYYVLVMMPLMALLCGIALSHLRKPIAIALVVICAAESVANQQHDFFIKEKEFTKLQLEAIANKVSQPNDKVALSGTLNPNEFYFLNRKGWLLQLEEITEEKLLSIKANGCKYFFSRKEFFNTELPFTKVFENGDYVVWEL
jgi:4-amino-4-deoxy-L-arabinose transferase-like glycosyltransferase